MKSILYHSYDPYDDLTDTSNDIMCFLDTVKYKIGNNILLVGNIGLPAFEEMDAYDKMDYFVYELSSHQLQYVDCSPHIAVLLNMYEDHLDHYKSYEEYL